MLALFLCFLVKTFAAVLLVEIGCVFNDVLLALGHEFLRAVVHLEKRSHGVDTISANARLLLPVSDVQIVTMTHLRDPCKRWQSSREWSASTFAT